MDKAAETDVEALDADDDPLWGRRTLDDQDLSMSRTPAVDLVQDAVVVHGEADGDDAVPILVVEADNGEARWKTDESKRIREDQGREVQLIMSGNSSLQVDQIAEHEDGWSMLLPAMSGDESGIAALDGASGELSWFLPLAARDESVSIRAADHGHAAVEIDAEGATSTAIVDLEQHEELWRQPDTRPVELTEDSVVVQDLEPGKGGRQNARGLSLLSLDGEPESRWSIESKNADAALVDAGHGLVVVGKTDGTVVLDAASGEELRSIGRRLSDCAAGGEALLCLSTPIGGDGRDLSPVLVKPTDDGAAVRELRDVTTTEVTGSYDGRFFLQEPDDEQHRTIDENGIEVDTELPGTFQEANEDGLTLVTRGSADGPGLRLGDPKAELSLSRRGRLSRAETPGSVPIRSWCRGCRG